MFQNKQFIRVDSKLLEIMFQSETITIIPTIPHSIDSTNFQIGKILCHSTSSTRTRSCSPDYICGFACVQGGTGFRILHIYILVQEVVANDNDLLACV